MPIILCLTGLIAIAGGLLYGAVVASAPRQWFAVGAMLTVGFSLLAGLTAAIGV